ncbi:hypothetical protein [uncultured Nitrospira sp.]|uniref:hypothetical protein n=1 Tax=uncultured Nitrospira sp. TaxID=157176 RepID=UPI0031404F5A
MDYVKPHAVVENMLAGAAVKLNVPARHLVIRGMLAGAYLGVATSMAVRDCSRCLRKPSCAIGWLD